jgi:hypothetical protein
VSSAKFWKIVISIVWGILGIPVVMFIFTIFIVLIFPFGGGIQHAMYAHVPGGNLGGAKFVFAGFLGATALVTSFLHWTRYPLPWYGTAILVSLIGFRLWEPTMYSDTSDAFRLQARLLSPLLPAVAFVVSFSMKKRKSLKGN